MRSRDSPSSRSAMTEMTAAYLFMMRFTPHQSRTHRQRPGTHPWVHPSIHTSSPRFWFSRCHGVEGAAFISRELLSVALTVERIDLVVRNRITSWISTFDRWVQVFACVPYGRALREMRWMASRWDRSVSIIWLNSAFILNSRFLFVLTNIFHISDLTLFNWKSLLTVESASVC
jgi:hypothetical protein